MQRIVFRALLLLLVRVKNWKQTAVRFSDRFKRMGGGSTKWRECLGNKDTEKKAFSVSA